MNTITNWKNFIGKTLRDYPDTNIYLSGGSVIGIYLLRDIHSDFEILYDEFNKCKLINDFDFVIVNPNLRNDHFYYEFGKEYAITLNGKTSNKSIASSLRVMRSMDVSDHLFELSVLSNENDCTELPMTGMKIHIDKNNYENFFILFEKIVNFTLIKSDLEFDIRIPKCDENGMFDSNTNMNLSTKLQYAIEITTSNKNAQQFLYYLIRNPTNLSRFKWKNISKSNRIRIFYETFLASKSKPMWLLNSDFLLEIVDNFILNLNRVVIEIYDTYSDRINDLIREIDQFENKIAIYECKYDLAGIGGSPVDVLEFLESQDISNAKFEFVIHSPRVSKALSTKKFAKLISDVELIKTKCEMYNVVFDLSILKESKLYPKMKFGAKSEMNESILKLSEIYELMFEELADVFSDVNIIRWKNNIEIYLKLDDVSAINCVRNIFGFAFDLKLYGTKNLSNNSIWLLCQELHRTKKLI